MDESLFSVQLGQGMGVMKLQEAREVVLRRLVEAGMVVDEEGASQERIYLDDMDAVLAFTKDQPQRLQEISVDDERLRFGPRPVVGQRVHAIVDLLQVADAETLWRLEDDDDEASAAADAGDEPAEPPTDKHLLGHGTLWIPSLGLGLVLYRGLITTVRLRKPEDAPHTGLGALTPSQRTLSARADLPDYLWRSGGGSAASTGWWQTAATLAMFAALGITVWQAIQYQRRWNQAIVVEGDVIDVRPPPPDPFPEEFTIAYVDQAGKHHQAVLKRFQTYASHKLGEKVELRYLPEAPDRPLSPSDSRDAAVERFLPWGLRIIVGYVALLVIPLVLVGLKGLFRTASAARATKS